MTAIRRLAISDLLPGDILLYRPNAPNKRSRRVSDATGSPYTHAAICLGPNLMAEAVPSAGVVKSPIDISLDGYLVGVLRSQTGFGHDRERQLAEFLDAVIAGKMPFNKGGIVRFRKSNREFFDRQVHVVKGAYGNSATPEELARKAYFCSGLVVACYQAVRIIEETAQVAYPPELFSPARLYKDATFGWLLGFLVENEAAVSPDDPLLHVTSWSDILELRWWR